MKLLEYPSLSRKICQLCNNDLEVFYQFRKDLIRKQKDLYRILKEKEPTIFKENNDFVEHSIENDLVFIKSETNELEEIELKSEKYKSKTRRKNVEKNNHDQKDENVSVLSFCDTCGHETTKMEMEIHMKIHVKKEIFYCEFCSREFEKVC